LPGWGAGRPLPSANVGELHERNRVRVVVEWQTFLVFRNRLEIDDSHHDVLDPVFGSNGKGHEILEAFTIQNYKRAFLTKMTGGVSNEMEVHVATSPGHQHVRVVLGLQRGAAVRT
jgi:hypothetical protein